LTGWHRGLVRCVALAIAALVVVPSASAWRPIPGEVQNSVVPSMIVTQAGTELVSFESTTDNTISVSRNRSAPQVVVPNDPVAGRRTQLVQLPGGAIELYFPNAQGVARLESTNDGQTWSGPFQTQSHVADNVQSAAVGPDGTPYFTQDGTGFVNVFRGLNGESAKNIYNTCCGYDSTVAVDSSGLVQVGFYSNATPSGAFLYTRLGGEWRSRSTRATGSGRCGPAAESCTRPGRAATASTWAPSSSPRSREPPTRSRPSASRAARWT
jgi:hypothetical protein